MINVSDDLKALLETITFTDKEGTAQKITVYDEAELIMDRRVKFQTPALVVRAFREYISPVTIGWTEYKEVGEITVSLYLKARASNYDAHSVKAELSEKIDILLRDNKNGSTNTEYFKLTEVVDRDFLEEPGLLRRDFVIEVYKLS